MSNLAEKEESMELDIQDTKEYKAAEKLMGATNLREFVNKSVEELKEALVANSMHMQEATAKVKQNENYQRACEAKADFDKALREDIKPYKVANSLAALLLRDRNYKSK